MAVQVIVVAHNQLELVKLEIKALKLFAGINENDIVIVDNSSGDGLREWLDEVQYPQYLICDQGVESYAVILNTAIREFQLTGDILILSPRHLVLQDTVEEMERVLYSYKRIGAVSASLFLRKAGKSLETALEPAKHCKEESCINTRVINLVEDAVLIKQTMIKEIGLFDERLTLPYNVILDYLLRGTCKDYQFYRCADAYFNCIDGIKVIHAYMAKFGLEKDREVLKEKWGMNYFNDNSNKALVACIKREKNEALDILEIGCDCGVNLLEVKRQYPYANLYGMELNEKAAEIASKIAKVKQGNIEEQNVVFEDVTYDYIMFGDVLEHLRDPAATIRYCKTLLKEDGKIIACIPNVMHYSVMRQLLNGDFTYTDLGLLDRTHIHFFTYKEIVRMFEKEGFYIEQLDSIRQQKLSQKDKLFVEALCAFSDETNEFMFYAYQYIVSAGIKR